MKRLLKKLVISTSLAVGAAAIATHPAHAGTLTNITIGGTAANDYYVYDVVDNKTVLVPSNLINVKKVLDGDATSPTGNVELRASSELVGFDFTKNTTLSGKIGGEDITLSSLTLSDWTSSYKGTGKTFAQYWFEQFYNAAGLVGKENQIKLALGLPLITPNATIRNLVFNQFANIKGFERASDPNIAYVNQDHTGLIKIGLTGHYDLKAYYLPLLGNLANFIKNDFQASEVVKYTYNGETDYLFSFTATKSGLTSKLADGDHSGNYEVAIKGLPPAKVPEPSLMLGVLGVAGVVAAHRKLKKVSV